MQWLHALPNKRQGLSKAYASAGREYEMREKVQGDWEHEYSTNS